MKPPGLNGPALNGLVLAGGRSRRMGEDKARLDFHGQPQARHACALLARYCRTVCYSIRPDQEQDPLFAEAPRLADRQDIGPMGGLLAAFEHDARQAWLVLACDLPLVDEACIEQLVAGRNPDRPATAFAHGTPLRIEPLCAIYEPAIQTALLQAASAGAYGLTRVLGASSEQITPHDSDWLMNANQPDDLARIRRRLA